MRLNPLMYRGYFSKESSGTIVTATGIRSYPDTKI